MPACTESPIRQLCDDAIAAKTETDVERILPELRAALTEHVQLAQDSLGVQARTLTMLNARPSPD